MSGYEKNLQEIFFSYYFIVILFLYIFVFKRERLWQGIIYGVMNTGFC